MEKNFLCEREFSRDYDHFQNPSLFMSNSLRCTLFTKLNALKSSSMYMPSCMTLSKRHSKLRFAFFSLIINNVVIVNSSGSKGQLTVPLSSTEAFWYWRRERCEGGFAHLPLLKILELWGWRV